VEVEGEVHVVQEGVFYYVHESRRDLSHIVLTHILIFYLMEAKIHSEIIRFDSAQKSGLSITSPKPYTHPKREYV
jgi:hypothetical protein